uniref:Riboflavin synthase alpha chain n=1 Tax=Tetraselmis sp. GSL018 TaxID=582737 RepID=A0A061R0Q6_9CHLO|mmetsp:Transcript_25567/g.60818  ORF Transcript_25567/g.60818 Transcript_25567/m.60818 type:complete len:248 (+) Transcript_25567:95-838(+)
MLSRSFRPTHVSRTLCSGANPKLTRSRKSALNVQLLFTGIVQGTAKVSAVDKKLDARSFKILFPDNATKAVQQGASVAINGTCLTVVSIEGDTLGFDVIGETLRATNLGGIFEGSLVNFERSARVGDEIGGHNVSGHVCCTAGVDRVEKTENNVRLVLKLASPKFIKYILPKGFVAVDGCSLTVGEVGEDWFSVYLIPETMRMTVFGARQEGDLVNIEVDSQTQTIVDTVERVVSAKLDGRGELSKE